MSMLTGARVVSAAGVINDGFVEIEDGRIVAVGSGAAVARAATDITDLDGGWLLPGFIDLHMHGGGGHDVTTSATAAAAAVEFHRAHGTTRTLVSLMAQHVDAMGEQLGWLAALARAGDIAGVHLEGPFLSAAQCGAQRPENLLMPDVAVLRALLAAGQGSVRTVTIAPELPGALELIRDLVAAGVVAAVGHTAATFDQATAGFQAGATLATHLFNAMGAFDRRAPGPAIAALDAGAFVEVINDGAHLHDALVQLAARTAAQSLVLVTDAISATGVGDGKYRLGGQFVQVMNGEARTTSGHRAGSTLTMDAAVRRAVLAVGLPIEVAAAAASTTPARVLGLQDRCGAIAAGLAADLVVLDDDLRVQRVMVGGGWIR
jgi:N-acetylglucosamine-6-phosphate deacetylase